MTFKLGQRTVSIENSQCDLVPSSRLPFISLVRRYSLFSFKRRIDIRLKLTCEDMVNMSVAGGYLTVSGAAFTDNLGTDNLGCAQNGARVSTIRNGG
jgi:hypothetical protein